MITVREIQEAVGQLSQEDIAAFRVWFGESDAIQWDRQLDADVAAG